MTEAEVSRAALARLLGVDAKTVSRWITGHQRPHPEMRIRVRQALSASPSAAALWRAVDAEASGDEAGGEADEIVSIYPVRAHFPIAVRAQLLESAEQRIDLAAAAMLFMPQQHPGLCGLLAAKASAGCRVTLTLADPASEYVRSRSLEEGMGDDGLARRIRSTLAQLEPLRDVPAVEVQLFDAPIYNSVFRFDDDMLAAPQLFRTPGSESPILHVRRQQDGGLFDRFMHHVHGLRASSSPAWAD